jgi:hypothetical protein
MVLLSLSCSAAGLGSHQLGTRAAELYPALQQLVAHCSSVPSAPATALGTHAAAECVLSGWRFASPVASPCRCSG